MAHHEPNHKHKNMNKKIIALVSVAVIASVPVLGAIARLMPDDQPHNLVSDTIELVASLLILPVRLYAFYVYGDHGSWSFPVLILLLALSGLIWGVLVERII